MAITVPALHGKMGTIDFYQTKMRAKELTAIARPASEMDTWATLGIEERLQRELNDKRVREDIIPYLAKFEDRFFGSLLVLIYQPELFDYESAARYLSNNVPAAYRKTLEQMGALTIEGGELIVLDGQHRLAALRSVVQGKTDKGTNVVGPFVADVPNDELVVVFIPFINNETTRRIFNKINKNAKPTGRSDNIITSEDDGNSIIARRLLADGEPLGAQYTSKDGKKELLVNWRSTTISDRSAQWTTISAVHESVIDILKHHKIEYNEKEQIQRPDADDLDKAYELVHDWWTAVLDGVDAFREVQSNPNQVAQVRKEHDEWGLLLKPATHIVLFKALIKAVDRGVSRDKAIDRLNQLDWHLDAKLWTTIFIAGGRRIIARAENYDLTAEVIAYLIGGDKTDDTVRDQLTKRVADYRDDPEYTLPDPIA
ncbi:DGQHR domain-containing protein [Pseudonocardia sp. KRD-184]|uniref:DGQHR domain-containing protein n=1 Tax=Pseudonocardia oceani TaxID=2792013 RepID=A0ABS6UK40_9PSEU|nr:DNA sulfur modification protein DndB [Pseudonocardia oceani]MBW0090528.1 DGQHR domain-containing protein [Pseudonocardia oceani]MBW0095349.1 DGQHR domain-containing protein [Pseudonocardia oceani]MBW0108119.1 DGQHR domain-containing protein [Pseudonocardia oceani]MBW0120071.1 DGQHR domain-containing protein [Pseudonocardia oceani]MBW0132527.1 DGQHR domain-containing protein [Pseudonocardia oceani]